MNREHRPWVYCFELVTFRGRLSDRPLSALAPNAALVQNVAFGAVAPLDVAVPERVVARVVAFGVAVARVVAGRVGCGT